RAIMTDLPYPVSLIGQVSMHCSPNEKACRTGKPGRLALAGAAIAWLPCIPHAVKPGFFQSHKAGHESNGQDSDRSSIVKPSSCKPLLKNALPFLFLQLKKTV